MENWTKLNLLFSTYKLVFGQKHPKYIRDGLFSGNESRILLEKAEI